MKNLMKTLAVALAIGSTVQAIQVYAQEKVVISIDEVEYKLTRLIDLKRQMDAGRELSGLVSTESTLSAEFPNIRTEADFKREFSVNALRYIQAIGGEAALARELTKPEFASFSGHEPGV